MSPRSNRTSLQRQGDDGERLVEGRLIEGGWQILARNLHVGRSEVDLLGVDPGPPRTLVLVEVRWRTQRRFGLPEETVDWRKRQKLRAAMGRLLELGRLPNGTPLPNLPVRIDIVAVEPPDGPGEAVRIRHHRWAVGC